MNLLTIKNLKVRFSSFTPVRHVSLAVKEGEFVGLVGDSGSGKSTVGLAILKLLPHAVLSGQILFKRQNLLLLNEMELRDVRGRRIAMIFQEPMSSLNPLMTVGEQIKESFLRRYHNFEKEKIFELLRLVELADTERVYKSFPHELSGGQRQRVMIAMALAGKPDLLIADEPTTALDVCVQAQILTLLKTIQQKMGLAILFITHDLDIIREMADRVYVMRYGKVIATRLPEKKEPIINRESIVDSSVVLKVNQLSINYGDFRALEELSFNLCSGQTIALIGESGSGKTSAALALTRLISSTGQIILNGQDFNRLKGKDLCQARSEIQMIFQDPGASLNPRLMVSDLICEGLKVHFPKEKSENRLMDVLKAVGLNPRILNRYPHELSGGQKTRVALARGLILNPSVLILDEVTASLDIQTQKQIIHLLLDLQKKYKLAYLFITHDLKLIRLIADNVIILKDGKVVEKGRVKSVLSTPYHEYTKTLLAVSEFKKLKR